MHSSAPVPSPAEHRDQVPTTEMRQEEPSVRLNMKQNQDKPQALHLGINQNKEQKRRPRNRSGGWRGMGWGGPTEMKEAQEPGRQAGEGQGSLRVSVIQK